MNDRMEEYNLHAAVRRDICALIDAMDLEHENRLPPEKELARTLQVSRVTVRSVLAELANEGKVVRRQGSGTFVNPVARSSKASLHPMEYYWNIIHNYGYEPSIRLLDNTLISARGEAGQKLLLAPESKLLCLKRAYYADGRACIYCIDVFDASLVKGKNFDAHRQCSIFQLLYEVAGCIVLWADVQIYATDTSRVPETAPFLCPNGPPKPLLLFKSTCYDKKNRPVLLTESYFDTDLIEFSYIQQYGSGRTVDHAGS